MTSAIFPVARLLTNKHGTCDAGTFAENCLCCTQIKVHSPALLYEF